MLALWTLALISGVFGKDQESLHNVFGQRQVCGGVYGPLDAKGPYTPAVNVSFPTKGDTQGELAVLVYDYSDIDTIGYIAHSGDLIYRKYMCDQQSVYANECREEDLGKFIVGGHPRLPIKNEIVKVGGGVSNAQDIHYEVQETGFYCVAAQATPGHEGMKFNVKVGFQNAYGHLPGTDYPLIMFHFVQSMVYLAILLVWVVPLVLHRHSVLRVQLHLTALAALMFVEQLLVAVYFYVTNKKGHSAASTAILVISSLWAAGRLAYTFFMLMIVAWGYSVVHPSIGGNMRKAQLMAVGIFCFAFAFSVLNYYIEEAESTGSWLDFATNAVFLPLLGLLAAAYFMTLAAMRETLAYLTSRKQMAKVQMYRFVLFVLAGALVAIVVQLAVIIVQFLFMPLRTIVNNYWRQQWLVYDGWPNIVYCVAFVCVLVLWRPNRDNMRYAMSTQLAQNEADADEFEIGSLNGSDDDLEIPTGDDYFGGSSGARRASFDAEANHELSDLEHGDEFEVTPEDRRRTNDEDALVEAPSEHLKHR